MNQEKVRANIDGHGGPGGVRPQDRASEPREGRQTKRILLVDDDVPCQRVLTIILRRAGYQVDCVSDGHEALRHLQKTSQTCDAPDLIMSDIHMPDCDGPALMKELDRLGERTQVIVMTGDLDGHAAWELRRHGRYTIGKPFTQKEVLDAVSSIFAREAKRAADAQKMHSMMSGLGGDLTLRPGVQS